MRANTPRRGYAMVMALMFIALLLSIYSVAYRQVGAALRIETTRILQQQRDDGSIHAVARGLALLETGLPPEDPYVCAVSIDTSTGERSFTVTFASETESTWSVHAAPTGPLENPDPMPATFAQEP
jgi:hypothetical protein